MATAYAALTSLMNLLTQLHEHPQPPIQLDEKQVDSLSSNIRYFQKSLEDHHNTIDHEVEIRIASAARAAEDLIGTHIADRIKDQVDLHKSLEGAIQGLDSIEDEVMKKIEKRIGCGKSPWKKIVVGFKYIRTKITSKLTRQHPQPVASPQSPAATSGENFPVGIKQITTRITDKFTQRQESDNLIISISAYKFHKRQVDSLCSKIHFLQGFVEDHRTGDPRLKMQVANAAHAAENHIEDYVDDLIRGHKNLYGSLQSAIECLDSIMKDTSDIFLKNKQSQGNNQPRQNLTPPALSQSPSVTSDEKIEVGIEEITNRIVDKLTPQYKCNRQIISISGMGGIGKTTLARNIYDHPCVKCYFDVCAWATISTDYNTRESLIELLHCLDMKISIESEDTLGDKLYKSMIGRRYLVILDDVWDLEAWDRLRFFLPASSGSAIVITTRETIVASMISLDRFRMDFLDEHKSWDLFCNKAFGKDSCPRELEDVGRRIANKCRGLPLSIVVIGGHLAKSPRTRAYWKYISNNLSSVVNSENDEHCLKVLSLSYMHLPVHLKPCFLYMGSFPEDKEIKIFEIIRLWMVERILKPINGKSLEEAAEEYLNDLIARNLILASKFSRSGKIKSFKMHDLLRDFCIKREMENKFFRITPKQGLCILEDDIQSQTSLSRSFYSSSTHTLSHICESPSESCSMLQQLPLSGGSLIEYSDTVKLECLSIKDGFFASVIQWNIPPSYCFFWNLHYLVLKDYQKVRAPPEIWEMAQLRHIKVDNLCLIDPRSESKDDILKNLQSAKTIKNFTFSDDLVKRVPNVKKLKVKYDYNFKWASSYLGNIARLEMLESFHCLFDWSIFESRTLRDLTLPHSLKKLLFQFVRWDDVTTKIGSLPLLESLTLHSCNGCEWKLVEGQFVRLKYLELGGCDDMEYFTAGFNHFPRLETLFLHVMLSLKEISSDIGDIPTLGLIKLDYCPDSAVVCAKEIADAQCEDGNEELQVKVRLSTISGLPFESMSTGNFRIGR